jgi:anti-anti-sigma factor
VSDGRIDVLSLDGVQVLVLTGEHDLATQPSLADTLERCFLECPRVIVDLAQCAFMDSSVLRALLTGHDHAEHHSGREFSIVAAPGTFPERILSLVKLSVIPTYPTREQAIACAGGGRLTRR